MEPPPGKYFFFQKYFGFNRKLFFSAYFANCQKYMRNFTQQQNLRLHWPQRGGIHTPIRRVHGTLCGTPSHPTQWGWGWAEGRGHHLPGTTRPPPMPGGHRGGRPGVAWQWPARSGRGHRQWCRGVGGLGRGRRTAHRPDVHSIHNTNPHPQRMHTYNTT